MCNGNFNRGFNDGNFFNKGCNCCSCNNNYDDALFREVERIAHLHAAEQEKTVVLVSLLTACVVSKAILDVAVTTIGITAIAGSITGNVLVPLHSF